MDSGKWEIGEPPVGIYTWSPSPLPRYPKNQESQIITEIITESHKSMESHKETKIENKIYPPDCPEKSWDKETLLRQKEIRNQTDKEIYGYILSPH